MKTIREIEDEVEFLILTSSDNKLFNLATQEVTAYLAMQDMCPEITLPDVTPTPQDGNPEMWAMLLMQTRKRINTLSEARGGSL